MKEGHRADDANKSADKAKEDAFGDDHESNREAGKSERLEDRGFFDPAPDDEEDGIGDEPENGKDSSQAEPAGEADELDHLFGGFGKEGFFWSSVSGLLVGFEGFVDLLGDGLKLVGAFDFDIELRDYSESDA